MGSVENITPKTVGGPMSIFEIEELIGLIIEKKILSVGCLVIAPVLAILAVVIWAIRKCEENKKRTKYLSKGTEDLSEMIEKKSKEIRDIITSKNRITAFRDKKDVLIEKFEAVLDPLEITNIELAYTEKTMDVWVKEEEYKIFLLREEIKKINSQRNQRSASDIERSLRELYRIENELCVEIKVMLYFIDEYIRDLLSRDSRFIQQDIPMLEELKDEMQEWEEEYERIYKRKYENTLGRDIDVLIDKIESRSEAYDGSEGDKRAEITERKKYTLTRFTEKLERNIEEKETKLAELDAEKSELEKELFYGGRFRISMV